VTISANFDLEPQGKDLTALLRRRAVSLAQRRPADARALRGTPMLIAQAGEERYGLALAGLAAVAPWRPCVKMPGGSPTLLGVASIHGDIWAVHELVGLLAGLSQASANNGQLVLLRHPARRIALRVDEAKEIRAIAAAAEPQGETRRFVANVTADKIVILSLETLWQHPALSKDA